MSNHEKSGSISTRKSSFQAQNRHALHKSWHRKDGGNDLRQSAIANIYRYKKDNGANMLKSSVSLAMGNNPPSEILHTALPSQPVIPHTRTTQITNGKEKNCVNIHVNPLFASGNIQETNLKSLQKLALKSTTSASVSKVGHDRIVGARLRDAGIVNTSGMAPSYNSIPLHNVSRPNDVSSEENNPKCITRSVNKDSSESRSIHVNPSILVGSRPTSKHSDALQLFETYKTLQTGTTTNNHVSSIRAQSRIHSAGSANPNVTECQRLIHVNPTLLVSNVAGKQLSNPKTSVHVNPKIYARLKSEVKREKPVRQESTTRNKCKLTPGVLNRSLVSISRTKLVCRGLLRSRKLSFRKTQQSPQQRGFDTPKTKKLLTGSRTPPSAVIKVAKSVCSKYKFIRKNSQTSNNSSSTSSNNKSFSFVHSTYKLDRRSHKSPRRSKKVKTYSVRYDSSKRNNYENNLQGILGHKRSVSSRNFLRGSKVWKKPGSLVPKKVIIRNRKLLKIGNSPNMKTKRNTSSSHKTLVRLGGVLYKTSRMKLTRTRTPRRKSLAHKATKQMFVRKSINHSHILHVRGDKFVMDRTGMTLKRISYKPEQNRVVKRIDIGGVTFIQKSKNVLIRTNTHKARNVLSQAKNKSIALLTTRMRKNNTHCKFYRQLGRCIGKEKGRCPCIHDPKYIIICKKLLKGECNGDGCLLSHEMIPEKMPICKFFMRGCCYRDVCAYLHVHSDPKAPVCFSFLQGYCSDGTNCRKRHLYVCPQFDKNGKCPKSKYCPYPHKLREDVTLNIDHMNRCAGDVPEVNINGDEPKPEECRYFSFHTDIQNKKEKMLSKGEGEQQVSQQGDEMPQVTSCLLLDGDAEIDPNVREIMIKRQKLFDEVFNLHHVDTAQVNNNILCPRNTMEVSDESLFKINMDKNMRFQMAFVDRVLSQMRPDCMPLDDGEWETIEHCQGNIRRHRDLIRALLVQKATNLDSGSEVTSFNNVETMGLGEYDQIVTYDWIKQIIRQCEMVCTELEECSLYKMCNDEEHNHLILSALQLIDYIRQSLWDLVNNLGSSTVNANKESGNNYKMSYKLVKWLENLLTILDTRICKGNDNEHALSQIPLGSSEKISACSLQTQDTEVVENVDDIGSLTESENNINTSASLLGNQQNFNSFTKRRKVGNIPYYIPLN